MPDKHPHTCPKCHGHKFKTVSKRFFKFQCRRCGYRCDDLGQELQNLKAVKTTPDEESSPMSVGMPNNTVMV